MIGNQQQRNATARNFKRIAKAKYSTGLEALKNGDVEGFFFYMDKALSLGNKALALVNPQTILYRNIQHDIEETKRLVAQQNKDMQQ